MEPTRDNQPLAQYSDTASDQDQCPQCQRGGMVSTTPRTRIIGACGRPAYAGYAEAEHRLKGLVRSGSYRPEPGEANIPYRCREAGCRAWHIGSTQRRPGVSRKARRVRAALVRRGR